MRKKHKLTLLLILLVIAAAFIYTRPMTMSRLCGDIDISDSSYLYGYYIEHPRMAQDSRFEITKQDRRFSEMTELFEKQKFKRSLWNFLPRGTKTHMLEDGDFKWELLFNFEEVSLPDGNIGRGSIIRVSNFFGLLEIHFDGDVLRCTPVGGESWLKEVMDIISE